jgi:hypothetical protein
MESFKKIAEEYGPEPFKFWIGTSFGVTIFKPADLQVIFFF